MYNTKKIIRNILSDKSSKNNKPTLHLKKISLKSNDTAKRFQLYQDQEGGGIGTLNEFRKAFPDYKFIIQK